MKIYDGIANNLIQYNQMNLAFEYYNKALKSQNIIKMLVKKKITLLINMGMAYE